MGGHVGASAPKAAVLGGAEEGPHRGLGTPAVMPMQKFPELSADRDGPIVGAHRGEALTLVEGAVMPPFPPEGLLRLQLNLDQEG